MANYEAHWTDLAKKLRGLTITDVRYLTRTEAEEMGWHARSVALILSDGTAIFPSQDGEGNGPGALFTTDDDLPTIPVLPL